MDYNIYNIKSLRGGKLSARVIITITRRIFYDQKYDRVWQMSRNSQQ